MSRIAALRELGLEAAEDVVQRQPAPGLAGRGGAAAHATEAREALVDERDLRRASPRTAGHVVEGSGAVLGEGGELVMGERGRVGERGGGFWEDACNAGDDFAVEDGFVVFRDDVDAEFLERKKLLQARK